MEKKLTVWVITHFFSLERVALQTVVLLIINLKDKSPIPPTFDIKNQIFCLQTPRSGTHTKSMNA